MEFGDHLEASEIKNFDIETELQCLRERINKEDANDRVEKLKSAIESLKVSFALMFFLMLSISNFFLFKNLFGRYIYRPWRRKNLTCSLIVMHNVVNWKLKLLNWRKNWQQAMMVVVSLMI